MFRPKFRVFSFLWYNSLHSINLSCVRDNFTTLVISIEEGHICVPSFWSRFWDFVLPHFFYYLGGAFGSTYWESGLESVIFREQPESDMWRENILAVRRGSVFYCLGRRYFSGISGYREERIAWGASWVVRERVLGFLERLVVAWEARRLWVSNQLKQEGKRESKKGKKRFEGVGRKEPVEKRREKGILG